MMPFLLHRRIDISKYVNGSGGGSPSFTAEVAESVEGEKESHCTSVVFAVSVVEDSHHSAETGRRGK
jgi:hypothetical protein